MDSEDTKKWILETCGNAWLDLVDEKRGSQHIVENI
jgi:hypothetical protein